MGWMCVRCYCNWCWASWVKHGLLLEKRRLRFLILEGERRIGDSWRNRYDSLVLFTPKSYSSLPGLKLEGDKNAFPTKDEIADYLETYTVHFSLSVQLETTVHKVEKQKVHLKYPPIKEYFCSKMSLSHLVLFRNCLFLQFLTISHKRYFKSILLNTNHHRKSQMVLSL